MSPLQDIQQQLLRAVMSAKAASLPDVRGDSIADAPSRMDIYRHGYRIRLRDALTHEFPGLRCMTGQRFNALLDRYIGAHPSAHYNIRWHGADLAAFLDDSWNERPSFAEMARLDWAISTAFDAADEPSIDATTLSSIPPASWATLRLILQDNLQVCTSTYNIDVFRRAADHAAKRPHLRRYAKLRRIVVWRHAMTVRYRRLDEDEWQALSAAQRGEPFASLCAVLAERHGESAAVPRMVALLQSWTEAGFIRSLAS